MHLLQVTVPALGGHVAIIVGLRPQKQVPGVTTRGVVTVVKDTQPRRDRTVKVLPDQPVSMLTDVEYRQPSVPIVEAPLCPWPALVRATDINPLPQPLLP